MKIVLARLQTALAIATANGDADATPLFTTAISEITPFAKDPYILPEVLTPPAPLVPATVQEVHDAVQAGAITPQQAVDAGVIPSVDAIPPAPTPPVTDAPPAAVPSEPTTSAPAAVADAPTSSVPDPVTSPVAATPDPISAPAADTQPSVAPAAPVADPSPPQPVDRLTALEQRVTADEAREASFEDAVKSGKVSRQ